MKFEKIKTDEKKLVFYMRNTNNATVNALRRAVYEIPVLAIDTVEIHKNDSALYDEILAHRLGLVPLKLDKTFNLREKCTCKGKGCTKCTASLKLRANGPAIVYASDLKGSVKPAFLETPIVILEKDQELELVAEATLGKGNEHAKFVPGLVWFTADQVIDVPKNLQSEFIDACKGAIKQNSLHIDPLRFEEAMSRINAFNNKHKNAVKITPSDSEFIFHIESFGQLSAKEIFLASVDVLDNDLKELAKTASK